MNEPAGEQFSDLLNDDLDPTTDTLDATDDADEESVGRAAREGLPRSFRMRHDAHYVEELMSRTIDSPPVSDRRSQRLVDSPAAPVAAPMAPPSPGAALSVVADRLESLVTHASNLRTQQAAPPLVAQSVHVEFARAARLARAGAVLQGPVDPIRRPLPAREIADAAAIAGGPVARLSGLDCEVTVDDPGFSVGAEIGLVSQAIAGTIDALVDLMLSDPRRLASFDGRQPAPRIAVNLQCVTVRPAILVDVICPSLFIASHHAERFFENDPAQFAGVPAAGILLAAAAHIVRAHGGRADVKRHTGTGVTVTFVFPQS